MHTPASDVYPRIDNAFVGGVINEKAARPPGTLTAQCPTCKAVIMKDFKSCPLSYPETNVPSQITLYCEACDGPGFSVPILIRYGVEIHADRFYHITFVTGEAVHGHVYVRVPAGTPLLLRRTGATIAKLVARVGGPAQCFILGAIEVTEAAMRADGTMEALRVD